MQFTTAFALLAGIAAAAPAANIDSTILNYALTLEHLENAFYEWGVGRYSKQDFADAGFTGKNFYKNLQEVNYDESSHVAFLTSAIKAAGYTPVAACSYNFSVISPETFVKTASILEGVGVSAYLGAANKITNPDYLTAAGSILTTEARHSAFIRNALSTAPFAQPYDIPLDFNQVYTLASGFITGCPASNPKLPVMAFPGATLVKPTYIPIPQGTTITVQVAKGTKVPSKLFAAFPLVTGPVFMPATVNGQMVSFKIPKGRNGPGGQTYAILTTSGSSLTDANTVAGPIIVPALSPEAQEF